MKAFPTLLVLLSTVSALPAAGPEPVQHIVLADQAPQSSAKHATSVDISITFAEEMHGNEDPWCIPKFGMATCTWLFCSP